MNNSRYRASPSLTRKIASKFSPFFLRLRLTRFKKSHRTLQDLEQLRPFIDLNYLQRRYPSLSIQEPLPLLYAQIGSKEKFDPHPLFDNQYYRAQLNIDPPSGETLLEHFIRVGASAGHDPSPLFSTRTYLDCYPDVRDANVNPLLHFISWGIHEGRMPLLVNLPDLKQRSLRVLEKDGDNPYAIAYCALCMAKDRQIEEAFKKLSQVKTSLAEPFYLKIEMLCLTLAGRTEDAEKVHSRLQSIPGFLYGPLNVPKRMIIMKLRSTNICLRSVKVIPDIATFFIVLRLCI
jgi:hypothetical protein